MKNKLMVLAFLASMSATSYADVKAVQAALDVDDAVLAQTEFNALSAEEKSDISGRVLKGQLLLVNDEPEDAFDYFEALQEKHEDNVDVNYYLGVSAVIMAQKASIFSKLSYAKDFIKAMERTVVLKPDHQDALNTLIGFHLNAPGIAGGDSDKALVYAKQLQQGMLKLIVMRSTQDIRGYGYTPSESGSACDIWLKCSAMTVATAEPLCLPDGRSIPIQPSSAAICLSSQLSCLPLPLAGLKSLNRLDNVLASGELQGIKAQISKSNTEQSIGEGLLRDMSGQWVEGTMSNVFYQLSESPYAASEKLSTLPPHRGNANYLITGQWYTPSMTQSGVAGVMRQVIIDALSSTEYPIVIRPLQDEDLPQLTQVFFCNALRGIMPMSRLTLLSGMVVGFE